MERLGERQRVGVSLSKREEGKGNPQGKEGQRGAYIAK